MIKEELVGKKFTLPNVEGYYIIVKEDSENIYYNYSQLLLKEPVRLEKEFYLKQLKKDWKLLPEETKMYTTPKGIKYGVGTKFTHPATGKREYPITYVGKDGVGYDGATSWIVTLDRFNELVDEGSWNVIQDYQSVDPSTIKFDFTNTKIKVNSPEEHTWIQQVAFNSHNNLRWIGSAKENISYTDEPGIYFNTYGNLSRATDMKYFAENNSKEITIQDILNSNQMKEVIEVGDVVEVIRNTGNLADFTGKKGKVTRVPDNISVNYVVEVAPSDTRCFSKDELKLVSKGSKQEIIGYELLKDLPGIPAGKKSRKSAAGGEVFGEKDSNVFFPTSTQLQDTTWFKPIYKAKDITLKFSKYNATLSKEYGLVFTDNERLSFTEVQKLVKVLANREGKTVAGSYDVVIKQELKSVSVGCKLFTPKDIELVTKAVQELQ